MTRHALLGLIILATQCHLIAAEPAFSSSKEASEKRNDSGHEEESSCVMKSNRDLASPHYACPVTVYYGLNDSHSRSWAQVNANGVVGITYFQRFETSEAEGTLLYKTIQPDGYACVESLATGSHLEKSVLLFDAVLSPHIFVASSNDSDQIIDHYFKSDSNLWQKETLIHFYGEGGKFIYELSADTGPDFSFHLLILKTRSNIDSDDFMDAWMGSNLYHLTNAAGTWESELIHNYDMPYTYDMYIKSSIRQDIEVDEVGYVHVTFGEQISGSYDPSRLLYATNRSGFWEIETALNYEEGSVDDAGWFPSLCLDQSGVPHISCMYVERVPTHSATSCTLLLLTRLGPDTWQSEIIAQYDDGYYGSDGRDYTGALSHLVFDTRDIPHIIFSDVASTHWPGTQRLNVGNIRYGVRENGIWDITTIYRQPLPTDFFTATEMHGMCLLISEDTNAIHVVGQELVTVEETDYSCNLLEFDWEPGHARGDGTASDFLLKQNHPNPFSSTTTILYSIPVRSDVELTVNNLLGQRVAVLESSTRPAGSHTVQWNGRDQSGHALAAGVYTCRIHAGRSTGSINLVLIE